MNRTIFVNENEPANLAVRHPLGIDLDLHITMKDQYGAAFDPTGTSPQFILMPRSQGGIFGYDMSIWDSVNGVVQVEVPGNELMDSSGYNIEMFLRKDNEVEGNPPKPTRLVATGALVTQGVGYSAQGPLSVVNIPMVQGPPGPPGPAGFGETGQRGSIWTTGPGAPVVLGGELTGDMYLDESNGDVYRFANGMWTRGTF